MFIDLIASLTPILIPLILGLTYSRNFLLSWITGSLIYYSTSLTIGYFINLIGQSHLYSPVIITIIIMLLLISLFNIYRTKKYLFKVEKSDLIEISTLIIIGTIIFFGIWKHDSPYPFHLNWDIYEHITVANQITSGVTGILPSTISDTFTFNGYTTLFHYLLALPKIITGNSLIGIYWWIEYWYYLITIYAAFKLAKTLFISRWIYLTSGIIAALTFQSSIAYTSLFLIPQNLTTLIVLLLLASSKNISRSFWLLCFTFILCCHFIIGLLGIIILISYNFAKYIQTKPTYLNMVIGLSLIFLFLGVSSHFLGDIVLTNREEAFHFTLSLSEKINLLSNWYGLYLAIFGLIGTMTILIKGNFPQKRLLILTTLSLVISLAPLSYFLKFFTYSHYFLSLIIAAGIGTFIIFITPVLRFISLTILLTGLMILFILNQQHYKTPLYFNNVASHFSISEMNAAQFLINNYSSSDLIISDPSTQYILEALSGINSQGGAYMTYQTRKSLSLIHKDTDPNEIENNLKIIVNNSDVKENSKILFVVSGRYLAWQNLPLEEKLSFYYNIWRPQIIEQNQLPYINSLSNNSNFRMVFINDQISIYEVSLKP